MDFRLGAQDIKIAKLGPSGEIKSSCCKCKDPQKPHNRGLHCKHVHAVAMKSEHGNSAWLAASASDSPLSCAASAAVVKEMGLIMMELQLSVSKEID